MDKINKALEQVIRPDGKWHDFEKTIEYGKEQICSCGKVIYNPENWFNHTNPDYFSKEGFWDAKKWIGASNKNKFILFCISKNIKMWDMFNYKTFAKHLYDFLVDEGVIKG